MSVYLTVSPGLYAIPTTSAVVSLPVLPILSAVSEIVPDGLPGTLILSLSESAVSATKFCVGYLAKSSYWASNLTLHSAPKNMEAFPLTVPLIVKVILSPAFNLSSETMLLATLVTLTSLPAVVVAVPTLEKVTSLFNAFCKSAEGVPVSLRLYNVVPPKLETVTLYSMLSPAT